MFENFGLEISKIFKNAEKIRYELKHPYVGSEHLLLSILKYDNEISKIFRKYDITYSSFKKELLKITGTSNTIIDANLYTPLLKKIIENANENANENNDGIVTTKQLLLSMFEEGEGIALRVLLIMDIDIETLYNELQQEDKSIKNFKIDYGVNLNEMVSNLENVVCRENEIKRVIETLLRHKKNNPLLVGKAGVGKTAIVEELARRINNNEVPDELKSSTIIMIEMGSLVSGTKYRGEFEEKLTKIIEKVTNNKKIILFIDEIHSMVNAGSADGAISASDILKPYLARNSIKMIGSTTINEYNKYFLKDKALCRRFEKILVDEPSLEDTKIILKSVKSEYEKYHNIKITNSNINDIVVLANKYIHDKCNPDKSIELLDSICAKVKTKKSNINNKIKELNNIIRAKNDSIKNNKYDKAIKYKTIENNIKKEINSSNNGEKKKICKQDILSVIEEKTAIPLTINNTKIIYEIEKELNESLIGQKEAINKIKHNLLNDKSKVKSMLFIGSSGIGKTMCAKIIGKKYNVIKLDMTEYSSYNSISKLIGVEPGYAGYDSPYIFETLKEHPHSLIILDEIEKANMKVLNLFLNILDEGKILDSHGEEIDFSNSLIIATGNIISEKSLGFNENNKIFDKYLSKELIARFDDIIEFNTLTYNDIYNYIKSNYNFSKDKIEKIINNSNYEKYGIRGVLRSIKDINCKQLM